MTKHQNIDKITLLSMQQIHLGRRLGELEKILKGRVGMVTIPYKGFPLRDFEILRWTL